MVSKVILIDNGHGVDTPGKKSPDGTFKEYLFNRQVAELVFERLVGKGINANLIVTEINDIPLRNRVLRVNSICARYGTPNVLLLSIHANAAGDGRKWMSAQGWSCYTSKDKTESDKVAECLYDAFEKEFPDRKIRKDMSDGDRDWEENFYIISKSRCPAVLIENFFYDNKEECTWLLMEHTRKRIAKATVNAIIKYLGL